MFYICIYDITMLLPCQMVAWEVLRFLVYLMLLDIVHIAMVASIHGSSDDQCCHRCVIHHVGFEWCSVCR